jgi:hypothetical protein
MDYFPAIALLISVMTIFLIIILKYGSKIFDSEYQTDNVIVFVVLILFIFVLITHLFKEQSWTADTLKIIIGVLIGAGSAKLTRTRNKDNQDRLSLSENEISGSVVNQALGDINQKIDGFKTEMSNFENSTLNQFNTITEKLFNLNTSGEVKINHSEDFQLEITDDSLINELEEIIRLTKPNSDKVWEAVKKCLEHEKYKDQITVKIQQLKKDGWTIKSFNFLTSYKHFLKFQFLLERSFK